MKYIEKSPIAPNLLTEFNSSGPIKSWDDFRCEDGEILEAVSAQLYKDQRGLCAYCEIDLLLTNGTGYSDFRIEHFHPKSDNHPEWTFRWDNLLAVCCGGNRNHLTSESAERFTSPDHSCDVPKGEKNLDQIIFNPTREKALLGIIFEYRNSGEMIVADTCPSHLREMAKTTITQLNLSSTDDSGVNNSPTRLKKQRAAMLAGLQEQVAMQLEAGLLVEDVLSELASALFRDGENANWPKFFSCVRWYLGSAAEDRLREIGYISAS